MANLSVNQHLSVPLANTCDTMYLLWGRSSAGRALHSHCRGQEFDPPRLHQSYYTNSANAVNSVVSRFAPWRQKQYLRQIYDKLKKNAPNINDRSEYPGRCSFLLEASKKRKSKSFLQACLYYQSASVILPIWTKIYQNAPASIPADHNAYGINLLLFSLL